MLTDSTGGGCPGRRCRGWFSKTCTPQNFIFFQFHEKLKCVSCRQRINSSRFICSGGRKGRRQTNPNTDQVATIRLTEFIVTEVELVTGVRWFRSRRVTRSKPTTEGSWTWWTGRVIPGHGKPTIMKNSSGKQLSKGDWTRFYWLTRKRAFLKHHVGVKQRRLATLESAQIGRTENIFKLIVCKRFTFNMNFSLSSFRV